YGYLKEIVVRRANQKEYAFKEADFQGDEYVDLVTALRLFSRRILLKKRVEDVQLRVESYQTKLNITMPQVRVPSIDAKEPYIIPYKPRGVVYLNKTNCKYLMREDELYKFGDGTLKNVHDILDSMLHNFDLGYNNPEMPTRARNKKDQRRTSSMLEKINKTLLERQIMRSLECFIGGRKIQMDYRVLMQTE
ncbi:hypothetical protein Tco_1205673, partial [Tanacetum coccineum]